MKTMKKRIILLFFALLLGLSLVACSQNTKTIDSIQDIASSENSTKAFDLEGNLLIPFDLAYQDAFHNGELPYDEKTLLIKLFNGFNPLTRNLKNSGIESIHEIVPGEDASWYKAILKPGLDVKEVMNQVRSLNEVILAEYNFTYQTTYTAIDQNPKAGEQWYLNRYGIKEAWAYLESLGYSAGGGENIVVAVIDTGVDITHPDLINNIWRNVNEIDDGIDNDGNGYVDDIYGVNVVGDDRFESGNVLDDHGHGTHVAGIIAASNNTIGTVGVAFNVKIMPVKAGSASGQFAQADIAEAVLYAYENGADVINMSFGGQAISIAVQDALMAAYTRSVLVASAGNSGKPNELADSYLPEVNYPAALPYVIGVMSVDATNKESGFTNWDLVYNNNIEYEIYMTGEQITSTIPGNRYATWSGTSMAAPIISAMAAMLRTVYSDRDQYPNKFIMGQIISTSTTTAGCGNTDRHTLDFEPHKMAQVANVYEALTIMPKPFIKLYDFYTFDSKSISLNNNEDGAIDNNETIEIGFVLQNRWGMGKDTVLKFDTENEFGLSSPYVEFLTNNLEFGSIGTYSTKDFLVRDDGYIIGTEVPLQIKLAQNTPNDTTIFINMIIEYKNALDEEDETIYKMYETLRITVRNGVVLPNVISSDMTLTKDNYYIIPNAMLIEAGATVTVEAGTKVQFWSSDPNDPYATKGISYINVEGVLITEGTTEEPVEFFPSELFYNYSVHIFETGKGRAILQYTNIINPKLNISYASHCRFSNNVYGGLYYRFLWDGILSDSLEIVNLKIKYAEYSIFSNMGGFKDSSSRGFLIGYYANNLFYDVTLRYSGEASFESNVFLGNNNLNYGGTLSSTAYFYPLQNINPNATRVLYRTETNTSYVSIGFQSNPNLTQGFAEFLKRLAEYMGGHLATFETYDEFEFVATEFQDPIFVGLTSNPRTRELEWITGDSVGDYIQFTHYTWLDYTNPLAALWGGGFGWMNTSRALIEIPLSENQVQPTKDDIMLLWNQFATSGENGFFRNNAILNKLSDPDSSKWMLFMGADVSTTSSADYIKTMGLAHNYWGNTNANLIEEQILDFDDYQSLQNIIQNPILTEAPELAFPYVTSVKIYNVKDELIDIVANEPIRVVVTFSKDMDTTIPLRVRFGSKLPFADYELEGEYIDARTWEGVYTLNTLIENGMQYFNISNGASFDDAWFVLMPDTGRFTFKIDTTLAQAMIMQGSATPEGIELEWYQDDFDTLAGYNVYRSEYEDGFYVRLNKNIIPSDVKEFFDQTVLPGKVYYYNFTVVKTDLTESLPSGKLTIQSLDTMAPNIYHTPIPTGFTTRNFMVSAVITDNLAIHQAKVFYRVVGQTQWMSTTMSKSNDRFTAIINADYLVLDGLEYYIEATDGYNITRKGTPENPFVVVVQLAVSASSLGDVNGDGMVTTLDALMMLMAINDRLNLTQEQFARADIDENGILETWEVLRILYYVSGKVQTIKPTS